MNDLVLGILAHVDSGKTTMSEALLYKTGRIKSLGRVDHKDAYLDNFYIERQRGITVFSKQAVFELGDKRINLLDTPGHSDFSSEMERTLSVLDYAVLVISGPDGVQAHTRTLWTLLRRYRLPVFVFVNKMDICEKKAADITEELSRHLGDGFADLSSVDHEKIAELDETALEEFLKNGVVSDDTISKMIRGRRLFPCYFGSALKLDGIDDFLAGLDRFAKAKEYPEKDLGAKVFKITRDDSGKRLTWIKLTGGKLRLKDLIGEEKINEIRIYSGLKYERIDEAEPGGIYALLGLEHSAAGTGLGFEKDAIAPALESVLSYQIILKDGTDPYTAMQRFDQLSEEDPMLRIEWDAKLRQISARLMGEVQIDILKEIIKDRFDMDVEIGRGRISYKETIAEPVTGAGHFEPLRHYAETHLLLEPLEAGTGLVFTSLCKTDDLDLNWQRLILSNLMERELVGVLTGSELTDVRISLIAGRAHLKHTEGGDFREASHRALRQALMKAKNVLLEPYYDYVLEIPAEHIGRAISDLKAMSAEINAPEEIGDTMVLKGSGPAIELQNYHVNLLSYTAGRGRLSLRYSGYYPCHNTEKVIEEIGYVAERDIDNPADSVFCSHGAGVNVKWNRADEFMHLDSGFSVKGDEISVDAPKVRTGNIDFDEKELEAIMLKEFGGIKRPDYESVSYDFGKNETKKKTIRKDYLIVDGYNIIYAIESLASLAKENVESARQRLLEMLINYRAYKGNEVCLVFDGYNRKDNPGAKSDEHGVRVVYTKEGQSADNYIETLVHEIGKNYSVRVATSDGLIQLAALRSGVIRMSAREFEHELNTVLSEISDMITDLRPDEISLKEAARFVQDK